jgi:ribose-phosphate pyrophosphokinase
MIQLNLSSGLAEKQRRDVGPDHTPGSVSFDNNQLSYTLSTFPGGEVFFRLNPTSHDAFPFDEIQITTRLNNAEDIMLLFMATDAVRRKYPGIKIHLFVPYLPYARQDRVCTPGEAFSLKVFGNMINAQGYESVTVLDAHSTVADACIDRLTVLKSNPYVIEAIDLIRSYSEREEFDFDDQPVLVSPDAGAMKKVFDLAEDNPGYFDSTIVVGQKIRDLATGDIIKTDLHTGGLNLKGRDVVIVDDICDGGRTFIELAKVLRAECVRSITLFVTHGIFSKGLSVFTDIIDIVVCTNSIGNTTRIANAAKTYTANYRGRFINLKIKV